MTPDEHLKPRGTKVHGSVARVTDDWYIACESRKLKDTPLPVTILGIPIVVFRLNDGSVGALLDRCPHRNAPLSLGAVKGDALQCAYHGWEFDRSGTCLAVPGLIGEQVHHGRRAPAYPVMEQDGFVWVYTTSDVEPSRPPFRFPLIRESGYTTVRQEFSVEASLHATAENALDVPHTGYLHGGLFRSSRQRGEITVHVTRHHDRVEAEYVGESRPSGLVGRLLAPGGGTVIHVDRFILPSIAQVEYRLGNTTHLCVTSALVPVLDYLTRLFIVTSLRLPIPGWPVAPIITPLALRIFRQDEEILKHQTENISRFGGEQFVSTEIDVIGSHIHRLLRQAGRGERNPSKIPFKRTIRMVV